MIFKWQYLEVEKLTRSSVMEASSSKTSAKSHSSADEVIRGRSSEKRRRSRSRSPYNHREFSADKSRTVNEYRHRSKSPVGERNYPSTSRAPRRRSRSPKRYADSHRSPSSKYRSLKQDKRPLSPKVDNYFVRELGSESKDSGQQSISESQRQAELERRIIDILATSALYGLFTGSDKPPDWRFDASAREDFPFNSHQPYQQSYGYGFEPQNRMPIQPPYDAERQFEGNPGFSEGVSKSERDVTKPQMKNYFVLLTGVDPIWDYKKVQAILKGFFAPQGHIKFDKDRKGIRTGKVVVKVANKEDYDSIINIGVVKIDGVEVKFSKCNFSVLKKLFPLDEFNKFPISEDLCYALKGIPFSCKYKNVVEFFQGYEIADILIIYSEDGKATGTGFVCFKTRNDYVGAFSQNGKKIFHRYIEMLPCSLRDMIEAKNNCASFQNPTFDSSSFNNPSFNSPSFSSPSFRSPSFNSPSFTPYSVIMAERRMPVTRRPLCVLITGLPPKTTAKKICTLFSKSDLNPDAIHLTVNNKKLSNGRAFVEFSNFRDFDAALKFHGEKLDENIICVKQILFDEMMKILDSQRARHHFKTPAPAPAFPAPDVPERVPYMWEPPDAAHIPSELQVRDRGARFDDGPDFRRDRFQGKLDPPSYHFGSQTERPFNPNENPAFFEYFDSYRSRNTYSSNPAGIFPSPVIPQNNEFNMYERLLRNEGLTKDPFPMGSNADNDIDLKISALIDTYKKYENNIKTSRLSPDHEAALLDFINSKKP